MLIFAVTCGYLAACLCLSAMTLRFCPESITSRLIDQRLWLCIAFPLLAAIDLLVELVETAKLALRLSLELFDRISGRSPRRKRVQYSYFSYGYVPSKPRKSSVWGPSRKPRRQRRSSARRSARA